MSAVSARLGQVRAHPQLSLFYVVTIAFSAFFVFAFHQPMTYVVTAFLPDFHEPVHRVHTMMIGSIFLLFTLGLVVQLYRPTERIGGLLVSILLIGSVSTVGLILSGPGLLQELALLIVAAILITALHPARNQLFDAYAIRDLRLLIVAAVGAIALFTLAAFEAHNHLVLDDSHVHAGHYMLMAGGGVAAGLAAIGAAVHTSGWRALALGAAFVALVPYGLGMLAFSGPEQGSGFPTVVTIGVIVWALVFVVLAEYIHHEERNRFSS